MSIDEIVDDLEERFAPFCDDAAEALRHLHSENAALRQENEQLQIEISLLKEENKFISKYLCTPKLGAIKND